MIGGPTLSEPTKPAGGAMALLGSVAVLLAVGMVGAAFSPFWQFGTQGGVLGVLIGAAGVWMIWKGGRAGRS